MTITAMMIARPITLNITAAAINPPESLLLYDALLTVGPGVGTKDALGDLNAIDVGSAVGAPTVVVTAATANALVTVPICNLPGTAAPAIAKPLLEISVSLREEEVKTEVGIRHWQVV
jgi:hypothetical protein